MAHDDRSCAKLKLGPPVDRSRWTTGRHHARECIGNALDLHMIYRAPVPVGIRPAMEPTRQTFLMHVKSWDGVPRMDTRRSATTDEKTGVARVVFRPSRFSHAPGS